ncbi:EscU/YscU/HrcU family type III secretion system export apparatus switch protein [Roseomonas sp. NAR14]|uniref:EscU/YscU/HrcU family type III secretion system export apparatus switch protein n=1 Tax=Roseomonas acroporae TaxID=2937791 RepID=A0A9X2BSW8_9PROT|nr:EscU/YscU/HrcU family type III secretion system export apparatus switch protein [Roseomonas acroporae]
MAEGGEAEDRTESPTARRLEQAREEGQVPLSREAVSCAVLLAASLAALISLPTAGQSLLRELRGVLERSHELDWRSGAVEALFLLLRITLPVLGAAALGAVASTLLQTGMLVSARGLKPDFGRLNPLAGLKRLLGPDHLVEFGRTLLKLAMVAGAVWQALGSPGVLQSVLHQSPGGLLGALGEEARRLLLAVLGAFLVLAGIDVFWVRLRLLRRLRMSREDLRQEMRDSEGDPHIKARLKRLRLSRARRRMLAAVPKATVVVTNPTHYAVALLYEQGRAAAPKVVAKGVDAMAARIRAVAEEHGVPLVANPPLARALYRLEPDTEIPAEHYQAVADIIAYVWRLRRRAPGRL